MKRIELKVNHLKKNSSSYITDYLGTLGIAPENVASFIDKPRNEDELQPQLLDNMEDAAMKTLELLNDLNNPTKVFVQVDSDTDGYTSSSILINYLRRRFGCEVVWRLHNGKEHGIIPDTIPEDCNLIFIPDAGSNQFDEQELLAAQGKTVIILDHHEVTDEKIERLKTTPAIIVNNQLSPNFSNKNLSGAGVVYKFIKMIDRLGFDDKIYQDYGDLAAVGIIADAMNMTTLDNNYIAYYGLSHVHSKFLHALAVRQARGIKNPDSLTKIDVAFYIAPVINGVIRSGAPEDKEMVFRALTEENNTEDFVREWRGTVYHENLYDCAARLAANAKSRQDAAKKKSFEWLCGDIREKGLDKDNVIIATLDTKQSVKVSPNITGLIAMELVKEFNKPCLVLRETMYDDKRMFGGSGRNGTFYGLPDLKSFLHEAGAYYCEGHANAFGAYLTPEQIPSIRQYSNEHLSAEVFDDTVYEVDYWFHTGERIDGSMLMDIAEYEWLWGNSIPQPKFAFSITLKKDDVKYMGKDNTSLRFNADGVDFVAFSNMELINLIESSSDLLHIDFIGRAQINEWMGNRKVQVIIDDFTVFQPTENKIDIASLI